MTNLSCARGTTPSPTRPRTHSEPGERSVSQARKAVNFTARLKLSKVQKAFPFWQKEETRPAMVNSGAVYFTRPPSVRAGGST
jgi:hypothetical protein